MSLRLHKKFGNWLDRWGEANIDAVAKETCKKWLMGDVEHAMKKCYTECKRDNDLGKSPYYPYNRYAVKYAKSVNNECTTNIKTERTAGD